MLLLLLVRHVAVYGPGLYFQLILHDATLQWTRHRRTVLPQFGKLVHVKADFFVLVVGRGLKAELLLEDH